MGSDRKVLSVIRNTQSYEIRSSTSSKVMIQVKIFVCATYKDTTGGAMILAPQTVALY